ncbi:MAG: hypothetical protein ACI91F_002847 [Candidatus Binatia bacterium]
MNDARTQTRYTWLVAWCAAFAAHRGLLAAFAFDRVWYWEEAYRLLIAQSLIEGWGLSPWQLQADPYNGGSLAMGVVAMPFVALLGNSWIAAKLVAIVFATLGLALWALAIDRAIGRRAAHLFALAWIAAPTGQHQPWTAKHGRGPGILVDVKDVIGLWVVAAI